jgi:outer membrane receptor protein involved in Fe transport
MTLQKLGTPLMLLVLTAAAGNAQTTEKELDPVTVTSGLNPGVVSQSGRNIQVIRGEQLLRLPVSSIDELLRYVPASKYRPAARWAPRAISSCVAALSSRYW